MSEQEPTFKAVLCARCGTSFGLLPHIERNRRADGQVFYCPNGHDLRWKKKAPAPPVEREAPAPMTIPAQKAPGRWARLRNWFAEFTS